MKSKAAKANFLPYLQSAQSGIAAPSTLPTLNVSIDDILPSKEVALGLEDLLAVSTGSGSEVFIAGGGFFFSGAGLVFAFLLLWLVNVRV